MVSLDVDISIVTTIIVFIIVTQHHDLLLKEVGQD